MKILNIYERPAYLILLCAVFGVALTSQKKVQLRLPVSEVLMYQKQAQICEKKTGVPASYLKGIIDWTLPDGLPYKHFQYCVAFNTGVCEKDGHFNVEKMKQTANVVGGTQEEYDHIIQQCNKVTSEDAIETLRLASACVFKDCEFTAEIM